MPGAGKSYFCQNKLIPLGYKYINQDTLKTKQACFEAAENFCKEGKSFVLDNTNPAKKTRMEYISLARKYGMKCKIMLFSTDVNLCHHNNAFRSAHNMKTRVPQIVYNMFKKNFEQPTNDEGEIVEIPFVKTENNKEWEKYYV